MKQLLAPVISNRELMSGVYLLWLECPEIASVSRPGQFVMLNCGSDTLLRRPLSIHQVKDDKIAFLFSVVGKGTQWLSQRQLGDSLDALGPMGKGFTVPDSAKRLLLIAGGLGIAPLRFLVDESSKKGCEVTLLYGTASKNRYPAELIPQAVKQVDVTEDGSIGIRGKVTEVLSEFVAQADQIFACGPVAMYRAMTQIPSLQSQPVQVSLEMRMACGFGVCYGCTIRTKQGLKQVCKNGPVFNLDDIVWDELMRL